ncbi:hypothetical protein [Aminobacter sp. HY435]|uniref:hypothetical protein n=1 Tax=Aminobacter sp. HY435 TaxID=2970917 RepID=UPI0022B9B9B7|nr:hypothetical protein [Aminobacter sp. HY435]
MMHFVPMPRRPDPRDGDAADSEHLALRARVEVLGAEVCAARRAANESLDRLNALMQPDVGESSVFVSLLDLHSRDKEALFEAMRRLEAAREKLRRAAS